MAMVYTLVSHGKEMIGDRFPPTLPEQEEEVRGALRREHSEYPTRRLCWRTGASRADGLRACTVGQGRDRVHTRDLPRVEGAEADPPAVA